MKLSKRQQTILVTLAFGALILFLLFIYIDSAFDSSDPVSQKLFGLAEGGLIAYWVFWYYGTMKLIYHSGPVENLPKKVQNVLVRKAEYIARTNHQDVKLVGFPLAFFKRYGISSVFVYTGCNIFETTPKVDFELTWRMGVDGGNHNSVVIESKILPVELAPDWLKGNPVYKHAIKKKIDEIELEMKQECKNGSLDRLKQAV